VSDYEIGYGKPPRNGRFKPGVSGNPKGRPKRGPLAGQVTAYRALHGHRFKALRCGRRFGKTELAKAWIKQGLLQGEACAWFAPQHMTASEVYSDLMRDLAPVLNARSKAEGVMRLKTGGHLDFWTLENPIPRRWPWLPARRDR
jgi:hypothetical protein